MAGADLPLRAGLARWRRGPSADVLVRRAPTTASRPSRPASDGAPPDAVRLPRPHPPRPRQRPQPRLPPQPARAHPRRGRLVLDVAGADVRRAARRSTRSRTSASPVPRSARWHWPGSAPSASSTTCTAGRAASRTASPTPWAGEIEAAAAEAGIRITLLDTCYLQGGIGVERGRHPGPLQRPRRRARGCSGWVGCSPTVSGVAHRRGHPLGAGCRPRRRWRSSRRGRRPRDAPLHAHVSEQPAENEQGRTPTAHPGRGARRVRRARRAVHGRARHARLAGRCRTARRGLVLVLLLPDHRARPGRRRRTVRRLRDAGVRLTLGSDSHAVIDLLEEARAVELDERLAQAARRGRPCRARHCCGWRPGTATPAWGGLTPGGSRAGALADLTTIGLDWVGTAGPAPPTRSAGGVRGDGGRCAPRPSWADGWSSPTVGTRRWTSSARSGGRWRWPPSSTGIGLLVTNTEQR